MNKKMIAIIMTAVMLFPTTSITALASNSGLEVQGSDSSIITTTDKVEAGNYTIVEDSSVLEESENKVTVDNKNNATETTDKEQITENQKVETQQEADSQTENKVDSNIEANTSTNTEPITNIDATTNTQPSTNTEPSANTETTQPTDSPTSSTNVVVVKPAKISGLKASVKNTTVNLTWKKCKDATSYNIYRSEKKSEGYEKIAETGKTKYADKNLEQGKSYYYRICSVNNNTEADPVTTKKASLIPTGPKAVKSLKFKATDYRTITLSWKASKGATKYVIYRATSENGKYKKVKTTNETTYKQSKLSCGQTYYYKIIPYADSLIGKENIIKANTKPDKVTKLKASANEATIKLTWKKGKGAASYDVYRSTNKSSGFEKIGETTKTKYYDENLESGKTYYYRVYSVSNGTKGSKVTCNAKVTYTAPDPNVPTPNVPIPNVPTSGEMRAAWISYLDYGTLKDKSKSEFTKNIDSIYDTVLSQNLNTVIVHVRAFGDAVYPSSYYGWANFITSDGDGPDYDPLTIMVEEAHKKGLSFHAWINPYRTSDGGRVNPASTSAVKKIVGGVEEIVTNYNVDGIHFDDYFYLSTDSTSQEDKMLNVNKMVQSVYAKIKSIKSNVVFGISPAGTISYAQTIGCDVDTWLSSSGYIDYICPQLYWSDDYVTKSGTSTKMFSNTMKQWTSINKNNTAMYAGLALYKAGAALETAWGSDYGWGNSTSNLYDQYKAAKSAGYSGYSLYRYGSFGSTAGKAELSNLKKLSQ